MSFDLFLHRFQNGEPAGADRKKAKRVLNKQDFEGPDKFGSYLVTFGDGAVVELFAGELNSRKPFDHCMFAIRDFTPDLVRFVWDFACAGDMVMINPQGGDTAESPSIILSEAEQWLHLPDTGLKHLPVCTSAEMLAKLLGVGFKSWSDYRDKVVEASSKGTTNRKGRKHKKPGK